MGRLEGWENRLLTVVAEWQDRPFVWGQYDCLRFCVACEVAIAGSTAAILGNYKTERGALRCIKRNGFEQLADAVSAYAPQIAPAQAQRGDWVMRAQGDICGGALGVVCGKGAAFMGQTGLVYFPVLTAARAWSIAR